MKKTDSKASSSKFGAWVKERIRKFLVALKKNPQAIPLVALCFSFIQFSLCLTDISNTTSKIQGEGMGLASFIAMLFMMLSFVCMLNAFPKRQKVKIPMVVLMLVMYAAVIISNIHYLNRIDEAIYREVSPIVITTNTIYIWYAYNAMSNNIIYIGITAALVVLEPVYAKLLKKINTSIEVQGSGDIESIDISDKE